MDGIQAWLGMAGGMVALTGTAVTVALRWSRQTAQLEQERISTEKKFLERDLQDLRARSEDLMQRTAADCRREKEALSAELAAARSRYERDKEALAAELAAATSRYEDAKSTLAAMRQAGDIVLQKKLAADDELQDLMDRTRATAGSVYVPFKASGGRVLGLVYLCFLPLGDARNKMKKNIIPLVSLAGQCFSQRKSFIANADTDPRHFKAADEVTRFHSKQLMNVVLAGRGPEPFGVLQLLNPEPGAVFDEKALSTVVAASKPLTRIVGSFLSHPGALEALGVTTDAEESAASVLVTDLTNSSRLFSEFSSAHAVHLLNDYLEVASDIVLKAGGTIDKYLGDGLLARFNIPRTIADHQFVAAKAAMAVNAALAEKRKFWSAGTPQMASLRGRCAVASGRVTRATIGHPQFQQLTIIGYPVTAAAVLCDTGPRDRDIVLLDQETRRALDAAARVEPLPLSGKASLVVAEAYELTGLAE